MVKEIMLEGANYELTRDTRGTYTRETKKSKAIGNH